MKSIAKETLIWASIIGLILYGSYILLPKIIQLAVELGVTFGDKL